MTGDQPTLDFEPTDTGMVKRIEFFAESTPKSKDVDAFPVQRKRDKKWMAVITWRKSYKPFEKAIKEAADWDAPARPTTGAIRMDILFTMPRPKNHYRTGAHSDQLKPTAPTYHTKKPDIDKMERVVLDALTGVHYVDDSQVCAGERSKIYGEVPGVRVTLEVVDGDWFESF